MCYNIFMQENEQIPSPQSNLGAIAASLYVSFQLIANILAVKIALIPFTKWAIAGGTIIYPLTFTLRDFVHKTLGKKQARQIVILAALVNIALALLLILVGKMRPDPFWNLQEAYEKILLPVWRITMASIVAQVVSELVDTEIFSWAFHRFGDVKAVLISNSVSIVVDSVLFIGLAFYGRLPFSVLLEIGVANLAVKFILSLISTPSIKYIPRTASIEEI